MSMRAIAIGLLLVVFGILALLKLVSEVDMDRLYDEDFDDEDIDEFGDDA
jgi:hypothetical protein